MQRVEIAPQGRETINSTRKAWARNGIHEESRGIAILFLPSRKSKNIGSAISVPFFFAVALKESSLLLPSFYIKNELSRPTRTGLLFDRVAAPLSFDKSRDDLSSIWISNALFSLLLHRHRGWKSTIHARCRFDDGDDPRWMSSNSFFPRLILTILKSMAFGFDRLWNNSSSRDNLQDFYINSRIVNWKILRILQIISNLRNKYSFRF